MADFVLGSNSSLIEFDDQQIAKIGAALQAVVDQNVSMLDSQPQPELKRKLSDETFFTSANINARSTSPFKKEPFSKKKYKNQYSNLDENEDEIITKTESTNTSSTTDDMPLIKEEFQLQEFEIKSEPDDNTLAINNIVASKEQNQLQEYEIKRPETDDDTLSIKDEQQQQEFEVILPEADDDTSNTYEGHTQYIGDEESEPAKDSCNDNDDKNIIIYSIESDSENESDKQASGINYNSFIQYICPECGLVCGPYSKWKSHTEKEHKFNTKDWLRFKSITNLNGESSFQCLDCNIILSPNRNDCSRQLREHRIKHLPFQKYLKCSFCYKRLCNNMHKHIKDTHSHLIQPHLSKNFSEPYVKYMKISCPICQQSLSDGKAWWQHLKKVHDYLNVIKSRAVQLDKLTYSCKLCQQTIVRGSLKTHILLHESRKSFQCTLCKRFDIYPTFARRHMQETHFKD